MLIVGTGGFAVDLLNDLVEQFENRELFFFNDTRVPAAECIARNFNLITAETEAKKYLSKGDNRFIVALGDNHQREKLAAHFTQLGGVNATFISKQATTKDLSGVSEKGVIIMEGTVMSWGLTVEEGSVLYEDSKLGHGSIIGKYCFVGADTIMSTTKIGDYTYIGNGVIFRPGCTLGPDCMVGAGSVVTSSFPANSVIVGIPAKAKAGKL